MRESINEAIASTVTDMLEADLKVSFTQNEFKKMGAKVVSPYTRCRRNKPYSQET